MRKLKNKPIKEKKEEVKEEKQDEKFKLNTFDYIIYLIFFAMLLFNTRPLSVVGVLTLIFAIILFARYVLKIKISDVVIYRYFLFVLISVFAWPINILFRTLF